MTLIAYLSDSFGVDKNQVSFHVDIPADNVILDIDTAIPCGLIINELVTNSLKHAFPQGRRGEIRIKAEERALGELMLTISDNGVGIPKTVDFRKSDSLGLHLVTILAEDQLRGTITCDRTLGTEFTICFRRVEA